MKIMLITVIFFSLLGCTSTGGLKILMDTPEQKAARAEREQRMIEANERIDHQYDGWTEDQVVEKFGAPSKVETVGSHKILYYHKDKGVTVTGRGGGYAIGNGYSGSRSRSVATTHYELTTFFFKDGKVSKWDYDEQ